MDKTGKENYRVIATVKVGSELRERVLAGDKDMTVKHIHDWLNHLGATVGPTTKICIAKAINGFDTPGLIPDNKKSEKEDGTEYY